MSHVYFILYFTGKTESAELPPDLIVYNDYEGAGRKNYTNDEMDYSDSMMIQNDSPILDLNKPSLYKSDDFIGCVEKANNISLTSNNSAEHEGILTTDLDDWANATLLTDNLVKNVSLRRLKANRKRGKLWKKYKNSLNNDSRSISPLVRVNMKSKKLYLNKAKRLNETHPNSVSVSEINVTTEVNLVEDDNGNTKEKTLLTRHFLKVPPRTKTLLTTLSPFSSTMRVRSRMSRDNRRTLQALERQRNFRNQDRDNQDVVYPDFMSTLQPSRNRKAPYRSRDSELSNQENDYRAPKSDIQQSNLGTRISPQNRGYSRQDSDTMIMQNVAVGTFQEHQPTPTNQVVFPSLPVIQPLQQHVRPKLKSESQLHQTGGRVQLSGSSSSPVEPIQPLLQLGGRGGGVLPQHPVFDDAAPRNLTGLTGSAAYLHCVVHNLANRSVSTDFNTFYLNTYVVLYVL